MQHETPTLNNNETSSIEQQNDIYAKWQEAMGRTESGSSNTLPITTAQEIESATVQRIEPAAAQEINPIATQEANLITAQKANPIATQKANPIATQNLTKISGELGSNEGGWYEHPNGDRYYVKFYKNPNQGRAEFVANAIYNKLGIKTVRSELINLDGREAVASLAVPGATKTNKETQRESQDVRKGFVADAFLANWDVAGLEYDNIVRGADGFYRIDNGGSLIFRAQGQDKAFPPDSILELQTLRTQGHHTGEIFANITEEEINEQARELIKKLSPEDIKIIVEKSGLDGRDRDRILTGLLGRREFLANMYGERPAQTDPEESRVQQPRRSISETIRLLTAKEAERTGEMPIRPRTEIICDHNHIEGQRIDVINKQDQGTMEFRFKLRTPTAEITKLIAGTHDTLTVGTPSGAKLKKGTIEYTGVASNRYSVLCDASVLEKDGVKVFIADPTSKQGDHQIFFPTNKGIPLVRTAIGLIKVEIPINIEPEKTETILKDILEKDLGIPDALSDVSEEAEKNYKIARYKWQHNMADDLSEEQIKKAEKLEREEVFPGYTTFVEKGKYREYLQKYGNDLRAVHELKTGDAESIYRILTQGLMCTTERFARGIIRSGKSSPADINTGGGDNVFTRIADLAQRQDKIGAYVVFKPEIFDRTDWYAYDQDHYGSTDDSYFSQRLSPDALFSRIVNPDTNYPANNEQMFRTGIGANYIEVVEVDAHARDDIIAKLNSMGVKEINGKSIEDVIVARRSSQASQEQAIWKQQAQKGMQAILSGKKAYTSIEEIISLAHDIDDDYIKPLQSMLNSILTHQNNKEQLVNDINKTLKDELSESIKLGMTPEKIMAESQELFTYLQNTFGISLDTIYAEILSESGQPNPQGLISKDES